MPKKYNKPTRKERGSKFSHSVTVKDNVDTKVINFGSQGIKENPEKVMEDRFYRSRRPENLKRGKKSAAYWSNKTKLTTSTGTLGVPRIK